MTFDEVAASSMVQGVTIGEREPGSAGAESPKGSNAASPQKGAEDPDDDFFRCEDEESRKTELDTTLKSGEGMPKIEVEDL
jgi:hypothetical protein